METMPVNSVIESTQWFRVQLKELGYREGENLNLTILRPQGDPIKAKQLLKDAINRQPPDLVVTNATMATKVAANELKGTQIPLLFFTVGAPVKAGIINELNKPTGTNITGKVKMLPSNTRLNIVNRIFASSPNESKPIKFGYIYPTYPSSIGDLAKLKNNAQQDSEIKFIPFHLDYRKVPIGLPAMLKDTSDGIKELENQVDYWWESAGPLGESPEYTDLIISESRIPIVFGHRLDSVKKGALLSMVVNLESNGRETALLAHEILNGKNPGTIAVTPPSEFHLAINLKTALKMKLIIPVDIMELAGQHIYR